MDYYRGPDIMSAMFTSMIVIASLFIFFGLNSDITINTPYLEEYESCQEELERTIPICPDVTCSSNGSYIDFWFGLFFGAIFVIIINWNKFFPKEEVPIIKKGSKK